MTPSDPVTRYMEERGCPRDLIREGLTGLLIRWEKVVAEVEKGYALTLDDYLNDMDLRDILAGGVEAGGELDPAAEARLKAADERFGRLVVPCDSLWGDPDYDEGAPDPDMQWWYYRRPRAPGAGLLADLEDADLMRDP